MVPVAGVWPAFPVPDDIHDSFHGLLVPGTMRDSLFLLQAVLEQQFHLKPREIMTDTADASDLIFGLFWLLG
jgi:TnpA family transposase|tara:strand:- start:1001 stop:1216 length:216 start_codon:yes stop_codon:yes gene_type:complete